MSWTKEDAIAATKRYVEGKCRCYPRHATWNPPGPFTPPPNRGPCDEIDCINKPCREVKP